jgi:hypothetical protein
MQEEILESEELPLEEVTPQTQTTASDENSPIPAYIAFLKEHDLIDIPEDIDLEAEPQKLEEVFSFTKTSRQAKAVAELYEALPEDFKPLINYALQGGTSVEDFISTYSKPAFAKLSLDSPEDQKSLIREHYKATSSFSDEKIDRLISLLSDSEDLKTEAEWAYRELVQMQENSKQQLIDRAAQSAKEKQEQALAAAQNLQKAIEESSFIHPQRKEKVKSFFFSPIQTGDTFTTSFNQTISNILQNPQHQAQLADLLLDYDPKAGFTLERLEKRIKTRTAQSFQTLLQKKIDPKSQQSSSSSKSSQSPNFDWESFLQF